ncbi:MAG: hypothetical protein JEZ14_09995 [Marinilabiliaceae bacterium]|nr:hypothetical protein [Marinilabiliaceae bacterium]
MIEVVKYSEANKEQWDEFVANSNIQSFLFYRDYMEYHKDRFKDYSLMLYEKDRLKAILPGNIVGNRFYSHQGLTFGGMIYLNMNITFNQGVKYWKAFFLHLEQVNINKITIRSTPFFYSLPACQLHDYLLKEIFIINTQPKIGAFIECASHVFPSSTIENRKLQLDKFRFCESNRLDDFWGILETNLKKYHKAKPVHTLNEIVKLKKAFPNYLKLFVVENKNKGNIEAGALVYDYKGIVKTQYLAVSETGRCNRAMHAFYYSLISFYKNKKQIIDLGTCMNGDDVNVNLLNIKERFGACTYITNEFTGNVPTSNKPQNQKLLI